MTSDNGADRGPSRPHNYYKQQMVDRIMVFEPASVLDVGCGKGDLLRTLSDCGVRDCVGLETGRLEVSMLKDQGLPAVLGRAEALPFADKSFDVVVMEYVAHHLEDLATGLIEAARVARRAVIVLDCWYDLSFASQQVAMEFDLWMKSIDRAVGDVHNPAPSAAELAEPFQKIGGYSVEAIQLLRLMPMSFESFRADGELQLGKVGNNASFSSGLTDITARALLHGISEDGAILFVASRLDEMPEA